MAALTTATFNTADVPEVQPDALNVAFRHLISEGRGLALLNGLREVEIRDVEAALWNAFPDQAETRLATALRFRALLDAFGAARLKNMLLQNGFKSIQAAVNEAAKQRLNARFGFRQQHFVMALAGLAAPIPTLAISSSCSSPRELRSHVSAGTAAGDRRALILRTQPITRTEGPSHDDDLSRGSRRQLQDQGRQDWHPSAASSLRHAG